MKGLLYYSLVEKKTLIIVSLVLFVAFAAGGAAACWLLGNMPEDKYTQVLMLLVYMSFLIIPTVFLEASELRQERMIKAQFSKYTLTSVSKSKYVLFELADNLLTIGFSGVLSVLLFFIYRSFNAELMPMSMLRYFVLGFFSFGVLSWIIQFFIQVFKNRDKAGVTTMLIVCGIMLPVVNIEKEEQVIGDLIANSNEFLFAFIGVCIAVYAVVYAAYVCLLKKNAA